MGTPAVASTPAPVFIGGAQRSGTTLLRVMLDSHPAIAAGPELHLAAALASRRRAPWRRLSEQLAAYPWWSTVATPAPTRDPAAQRELVEALMRAYLERTGKRRWVEKTPSNVFHFVYLRRLYPEARFVHCVRDGRDAVCSLLGTTWFRPRWRPRALAATLKWLLAVRIGRASARRLAGAYLEVRYESLVDDPERTLRAVLEFVGESWDDAVLGFHAHPHDWTDGGQQVTRPISSSSVGRWQRDMPRRQQLLFRLLAGRTLARLGYRREASTLAAHAS
jgi:hypothetical protein